jgi:chromosome segregation ATPase
LLTRYLLSNQTVRLQLPRVQIRLRDSEESNRQLGARGLELERELRGLTTQLGNTKRSSRGLQRQLEETQKLSSNTIQLNDQNKQLTKKLNDAERQIDELKSENHALSDG